MEKLIEIIKFIFIGAVQGLTETLPISSSGHLLIIKRLINLDVPKNDISFEILLHLGSLIAVIYFYKNVIKELFLNFFKYLLKKDKSKVSDFKYVWFLVIATIPAAIAGLLLEDFIEKYLTSLLTVGIALLTTSFILFLINRIKKGTKDKENITVIDAIIIGLVQALAIIPGISRSGSTVSMGLYRKFNIDKSLRFSFLLFIPVALGAALLDIIEIVKVQKLTNEKFILYLIAFLTSIICTYISLKIFVNILKKGKLNYFSIYCLFAGTVTLILSFIL
ncbi:MAG: pyrophosphate phosphatase [Haloplasmataceae bacterium]|nr:pyrophosphate phosphatase [Haloplasmataceae bacterium]